MLRTRATIERVPTKSLFIIIFLGGEGTKLVWASHILNGSLTLF